MIPSNVAARPTSVYSRLKRKFGGYSATRSDIDRWKDAIVEVLDDEEVPRWMIAAVTGIPERTLYRRLERIAVQKQTRSESPSLVG